MAASVRAGGGGRITRRGEGGPSLEGYGGGLRAGSVRVCWTVCDAGYGGYRPG